MPLPERQLVVAVVLRRESQLLLCRRPMGKRHGGLREFPRGKVHAGKSAQEALARELEEELGLTLIAADGPLAHFDDPGSAFTIASHPVVARGEPETREHLEARWVDIAQAAAFELAPTDRRFVEAGFLSLPP